MRSAAQPIALALAAVLACAGCTKIGATGSGGRHPWTIPHTVRIGATDEPDSLNKLLANSDAADWIANLLFTPVFRYDARGEFIPELATQIPTYANGGISRDNRTITLHLRPHLTWSDGAPLDARDIRFTWQAVMNPRNDTRLRIGWDDIASIDVPDPLTAVVHLRAPNAGILGVFANGGGAAFPPLPAHLLAGLPDINHAAFNTAPLSSGPYVLTRWNHGASLEFRANPRYWRGTPNVTTISYRIIPNGDTLFAALRTHDIDVVDPVADDAIDQLPLLTGVTIAKRLVANYRRVALNCRRPVLRDVRVRRAIAQAVDWDRMNATVYHGYNARATSDILPTSWAAPRVPPYRYDPAAARRLLDAAGWHVGPGGIRRRGDQPLRMEISATNVRQSNVQAELQMQQQLRAVGIDLTIKNYPPSLLFAQNGPLYTGRYDMEFSIDTNAPDPDNEGEWSSRFVPPHGANTEFLADPVVDRTSHAALLTFDRSRRKALYALEESRLHADVPAIFLYWQTAVAAYNSDLKNYAPAAYLASDWNAYAWQI